MWALAACGNQPAYDRTYSKLEPQLSVTSNELTRTLAVKESAKALNDIRTGNFKVLVSKCDNGYAGPVVPHGGNNLRKGYCNYRIYNDVAGWKLVVITSSQPPVNPRVVTPSFTLTLPIFRETTHGNAQLLLVDHVTCTRTQECTDFVPELQTNIFPFIRNNLATIS